MRKAKAVRWKFWIFNSSDAYKHISESFISVTYKPKQQVLQLFVRSEHANEQLHSPVSTTESQRIIIALI